MDPNVLCPKKADKLNHSLKFQCTPNALPVRFLLIYIIATALQYTFACANLCKEFNIQWTWYALGGHSPLCGVGVLTSSLFVIWCCVLL